MRTGYTQRGRNVRFEGPIGIGSQFELREDYFSFAYLHMFRRKELFCRGEDGSDSEPEPEKEDTDSKEPENQAAKDDADKVPTEVAGDKGEAESKDEKKTGNKFPYVMETAQEKFYEGVYFQRITTVGKLRFLVVCQLALLWLLGYEAFNSQDTREAFDTPPASVDIVITRFFCAIFLHISLQDETKQGLAMMKYAMNHPWKFRSWRGAFGVGLAQTFVVMSVEIVNLVIL